MHGLRQCSQIRCNPGKQQKTFPDYNPYTISKCKTCPKAGVKLAAGIAGGEMCAACGVLKQEVSAKTKEEHRAEYERLKADDNYTDVHFSEKNGGVKATDKKHNSGNSKSEKFFTGEGGGLTAFQLEKECQDEIYKSGNVCILLAERVAKASGDFYPALDSESFGYKMDIRSITAHSESYRNALSSKNSQLVRFNEMFGSSESAVCLYFHDSSMYDPNKVFRGHLPYYTQNGIKTKNIIRHVYCVVRGMGIFKFDF